ncbi:MAG: pyridoxal-phosphate dependent enzyme [Bacillota bacterium]|nr:pyridoxal-phosphate dependent enzyme [Bacillota bacterium]
MNRLPTIDDIKTSELRIRPYIHRTPVLTNRTINKICSAEVFFKAENFQKVGAFKARGAVNAVFSLEEEQISKGVATHSSGNHAAALAYAAKCRGIKAYVVMPENAPENKKAAVAGYGARIIYSESTQKAREEMLNQIIVDTGAFFIHPYNDYRVITGQATAAMELLKEVPTLDSLLVPVGGGGLLSGSALIIRALSTHTLIFGTEPKRADDAFRSLKAGYIIPQDNPVTIADGLRTSLGDLTFPIIRDHVTDIFTVQEIEIINAMRLIWERMKIIIEPSAAVPVAALLYRREQVPGSKIGIILSGGNADLDNLAFKS